MSEPEYEGSKESQPGIQRDNDQEGSRGLSR